jgi:hypothetical protein
MRIWTTWLVFTLWLGIAAGQEVIPSSDEPQVPSVHVLDDARIFASDPGRLAALEARLTALEAKYRFPVYVAVYDTLIATDVRERSQQFQNQWIGNDDPGLVAVFETDSGSVGIGVHPLKQLELDSGSQIPTMGPLDLSMLEQETLTREVQQRIGKVRDSRDRVEAIVNGLADEITRDLEARSAPASKTATLRIAAFTVGLIAATGLVVLLVMAWLRRTDNRARQRYIFPDVSVGTRLGAPYGGGKISSRDFSEPPGPRP